MIGMYDECDEVCGDGMCVDGYNACQQCIVSYGDYTNE